MNILLKAGLAVGLGFASLNLAVSQETRVDTLQNPSPGTITHITYDGADRVYLLATDGLYWTTDKGDSWRHPDSVLIGRPVTCVVRVSADIVFAGTPDSGLYQSTDSGLSWRLTLLDSQTAGSIMSCVYSPALGLSCGVSNGVFWSGDTGKSWKIPNPMYRRSAYDPWVFAPANSLGINSQGTLLAWSLEGISSYVFASYDSANSWTMVWAANCYSHYYDAIYTPCFDATDASAIYYVERFQYLLQPIKTTHLWRQNVRIAGSQNRIYTTDQVTNMGWPLTALYSDHLGRLFFAIGGVIKVSTDHGSSWSALQSLNTKELTVDGNGTLYSITDSVVCRVVFLGPDGVCTETHVTHFNLAQNYPNPFNPSTTIRFSIPERSRVRVTIFNLLGQQVAELANEEMGAGSYERTWNAIVASGLYFYRLEAVSLSNSGKRFVDVKKMVLLK
jgi:hypothetical protein